MKELILKVDSYGHVSHSGSAGFVGEHNAARIAVYFTDWDIPKCDYFRMFFETTDGKKTFTDKLYLDGSYIYYTLPFDITSLSHTLYWQLCGYTLLEEECSLIYKTEVVPILLGGSLADDGSIAENAFFSNVQNALNGMEKFLDTFNIEVGNTFKMAPHSNPFVTISESEKHNFVLNFHLPASYNIRKSEFSISASDFSDDLKTGNIQNEHVTEDSFVFLKPKNINTAEFKDCNISVYSQGDGTISFYCSSLPQNNIVFDALIVNI